MIAVSAGATCVPLDLGFTAHECQRFFADLRVSALVTRAGLDTACRDIAHDQSISVIDLGPADSEGRSAFNLFGSAADHVAKADLTFGTGDAFILMTSGSSSRPKTVPLTHAAVCLSACNVGASLSLEPQDRLLNVMPLFHIHGLVPGLLAPLAAGSSVVCTGFEPVTFFDWLEEFRPTWYTGVPTIHRAILSAAALRKQSTALCSLRLIRSSSSTLPRAVMDSLESLFGVPVIDTYGMTEAASQVAANPLNRRKPGSVGKAAGVEIAIMDGEGRPLPQGDTGEIALRGPTITRGYDNDSAATADAFRDGWFRTGDLGYQDADGYLFIVGRIKDIISRGSLKVAPLEIEQALLNHPDVVEAVVFPVQNSRLGEDVAAAVVLRQNSSVTARGLRNFASERLAGFKVPSLIRIVAEIPKGPSGKFKRSELAATLAIEPAATQADHGGGILLPRSQTEEQLSAMWKDLLELDQIGIDEDVFALGADSLVFTLAVFQIWDRFGIEVSFQDLFDAPTVAGLAKRLDSMQSVTKVRSQGLPEPYAAADMLEDDTHRLSVVQENVLRGGLGLLELPQFNRPFAFRIKGPLNIIALKHSLAAVMARHDALRTRFICQDDVPSAHISQTVDIDSVFVVEDLASSLSAVDDEVGSLLLELSKLKARQEALTSFDISLGPLLRIRLLRMGAADHILILVLHEMIVDGWSIRIFIEELSELYAAFLAGRTARLAKPSIQFTDFARWQRRWSTGDEARRHVAYWNSRLRDVSPVFSTATDGAGALWAADAAEEPVHVTDDLVARLNTLGRRQGATLFMTLLTGFMTLLAREGRSDICVATTMANRNRPWTDRIIGPIANTALICTRIDPYRSFEKTLRDVRNSVIEAYANQEVPFDMLAARLAERGDLDPASLVQVFFVLQNAFHEPFELPGVDVQPFADEQGPSITSINRNWLAVTMAENQEGIMGRCRYIKKLFEPAKIRHWMKDYQSILTRAASNPDAPIGQLMNR